MISAYGPHAERISEGLAPQFAAVLFDASGIAAAYLDSVERRARGERFYAFPLFDPLRIERYVAYAQRFTSLANPAERAFNVQHLGSGDLAVDGDRPATSLFADDDRPWQHVDEVLSLADEVLMRSSSEFARLYAQRLTNSRIRRVLLRPSVPDFDVRRSHETTTIVVWPGRRETRSAVIALLGLETYRGDVVYVGSEALPGVCGRFVSGSDPSLAGILALAACIVCTDPSDPCDAVALSRRGAIVVAPLTCGAVEYAPGVVTWDAGNGATLGSAIDLARSRGPLEAADAATLPLEPSTSNRHQSTGLVSLILPRFDDPADVRTLLRGIAAQRYPEIEVIVCDDGSRELPLAIRGFSFARLATGSVDAAVAAMGGEYAGVLRADFELFPDYVSELVDLICMTGAPGAVARAMLRTGPRPGAGSPDSACAAPLTASASRCAFLARRADFAPDAGDRADFVRSDRFTLALRTPEIR